MDKSNFSRIDKWLAKFGGERQSQTSLLTRTAAVPEVVYSFNLLYGDERALKLILDEAGVFARLRSMYMAFAREVRGKVLQGISGTALKNEVKTIVAKWTVYGLESDLLERIAASVFGIVLPS